MVAECVEAGDAFRTGKLRAENARRVIREYGSTFRLAVRVLGGLTKMMYIPMRTMYVTIWV